MRQLLLRSGSLSLALGLLVLLGLALALLLALLVLVLATPLGRIQALLTRTTGTGLLDATLLTVVRLEVHFLDVSRRRPRLGLASLGAGLSLHELLQRPIHDDAVLDHHFRTGRAESEVLLLGDAAERGHVLPRMPLAADACVGQVLGHHAAGQQTTIGLDARAELHEPAILGDVEGQVPQLLVDLALGLLDLPYVHEDRDGLAVDEHLAGMLGVLIDPRHQAHGGSARQEDLLL